MSQKEGVQRLQIAIQGEAGSFSHEAALKMQRNENGTVVILPCAHSEEVFRLLAEGHVDAAVIPIENSLAGSVAEHYDLLLTRDVAIESEALLRIRHNLIVRPGTNLEQVRRVYSHPVALAQCRRFFAAHPGMEAVPFYDTAGSVKQLMELGDPGVGGIASAQAALHYGGEVLAPGIEDNSENFTRFFLLRRGGLVRRSPQANKVSLAFTVANQPGTLVKALQVFAAQQTNLTRIESRPVHGQPWQYVFYTDYQISSPERADAALAALGTHCSMVKELGRYQSAKQEL